VVAVKQQRSNLAFVYGKATALGTLGAYSKVATRRVVAWIAKPEREPAMIRLMNRIKQFFGKNEEGATLAEYGLLLALIAVVCIAAITLLGTKISDMFNTVAGSI
jgi:pilus assembly protein Flp/PilA